MTLARLLKHHVLLFFLLFFSFSSICEALTSPTSLVTTSRSAKSLQDDITSPIMAIKGGDGRGGLRHIVFPIYRKEILKFVLIAGIKFFVVFVCK